METIQVVKLFNGDEIIGFCEDTEDHLFIREPLQFFLNVDKTGSPTISMDYWLPNPVVTESFTLLNKDKIIAVLDPTDQFKEYYLNCLDSVKVKQNELMQKEKYIEEKAEELMKGLLDSLQVPDTKFLH